MSSRILIKIGGRAFEGEQGFKDLATAIKSTRDVEYIMVHGGGAEISFGEGAAAFCIGQENVVVATEGNYTIREEILCRWSRYTWPFGTRKGGRFGTGSRD